MLPKHRTCRGCGKKFVPEDQKQYYCSNECQVDLPAHRRWLKCTACGSWFRPPTRRGTTCNRNGCPGYLSAHGRFIIFQRDNFTCIYCGRSSFDDYAELHCDHVVPRSDGGRDVAGNLVTSCKRCNLEKSANALSNPAPILDAARQRNAGAGIHDGLVIKL